MGINSDYIHSNLFRSAITGQEMKSTEEQRNHVRALLELNPGRDAAEIIRLRQSYLGIGGNSTSNERKRTRESISLLNATLAECRSNFWKEEDVDLSEILKPDLFANAPELNLAAKRLIGWYQLRNRIDELQRALGNNSLATEIRKLAPMTAREGEALKGNVIRLLQSGKIKNRKRGAKLLKEQFPDIYAMEPEWFEQIIHAKSHFFRSLTSDSRSFQGSTSPLVIPVIIFLTFILVFLFAMLSIWLGI